MSSITYLSTGFRRQRGADKKNEKPLAARTGETAGSVVRQKLAALRTKRVTGFFRAKAEQRAGMRALTSAVGPSNGGGAVLAALRSLRRRAMGFFSRKSDTLADLGDGSPKKKQRRRFLAALLNNKNSVKSAMHSVFSSVFGHSRREQHIEKVARQERQRHVRVYFRVCQALVLLGRTTIASAHKRQRREAVTQLAQELVDQLLDEQSRALARKFVATREQERLTSNARVIQRFWRRVKRKQQAERDAKTRLLVLLKEMPSRLQQRRQDQQRRLETAHEVSTHASALYLHRAAQRLGVRLIQRVWRGHRARSRARRLRDEKWQKFVRRRQRERVRDACTALLAPSEMERTRRKELEARRLARQQETPQLPPPRRDETHRHHQRRRGERVTLLEPLPLHTRPPRVSSLTGARVQCVPFSRFEKIVAQEARVNLSNVWVAIPVAHHEAQPDEEETARLISSGGSGLSPLLVGKGRRRKKGGLQTQYDWVPAHLLQSQEEREAIATRRRQRTASPSAARSILLPSEEASRHHLPN
ncbi:hypothetical protein BBJ28_00011754 [Nothophytophthora sp. Chile5]|nr:hypothetical protein BBJ28_00011754 [Nothophytophthora sp. Chile5]